MEQDLLPWALEGLDLGAKALEIGPGYGAVTGLIHGRVAHLTCVEIDPQLADALRRRTRDSNVTVLCEDASEVSLPDSSFDSALCFMMLHHVPSQHVQDRLLAELARTLRPGGILAGADTQDGDSFRLRLFRLIHLADTLVFLDPATFPDRLRAAGFTDVELDLRPTTFRFRARKPPVQSPS